MFYGNHLVKTNILAKNEQGTSITNFTHNFSATHDNIISFILHVQWAVPRELIGKQYSQNSSKLEIMMHGAVN